MLVKERMQGSIASRLVGHALAWLRGGAERFSRVAAYSGVTYYVAATGEDGNAGTSPDAAWKTLARANRHRYGPGDRLLLEAGREFTGPLCLGVESVGRPGKPIVIGSFGSGRATIRVPSGVGVLIENVGGVWINSLGVIGGGGGAETDAGIAVRNSLPGDVRLAFIRIDHVEVSGFGGDGIAIGGVVDKSGFRDVVVEHADVHDNCRNGINIHGEWSHTSRAYANENVVLRCVAVHDNSGIAGPDRAHTGSGIIMSDVHHGLIERCVAFNNGRLSNSLEGGPIGIWAHDSKDITIQHNEAYGNRTGGEFDGGGFDLDGGVTDSVLQYNYSHDNDGAGYMLAQYDMARPFERNVIRYNISQNDGRRNAYGAIHGFGDLGTTDIHNNTVYLDRAVHGRPAAIVLDEGDRASVRVMNNIFQTVEGLPCVKVVSAERLMFRGNSYHAGGSPPLIEWQSACYDGVEAWRSATGQERLDGADLGSSADPRLQAPGTGGTLGDARRLEELEAYRLHADSPLIGAGIDLRSIGVDQGLRDYLGMALDGARGSDVGALAFRAVRRDDEGSG